MALVLLFVTRSLLADDEEGHGAAAVGPPAPNLSRRTRLAPVVAIAIVTLPTLIGLVIVTEWNQRLAPPRTRCEGEDLTIRTTPSSPSNWGRGREADGQVLDAADERDAHRLERHRLGRHLDVGQPGEELAEDDRHLAAGEVRAEAEVRTGAAEADVRVGIAAHVEALGIVEHAGIAVGDAVEQDDLVAFGEVVAREGDVGRWRCGA